MNREPAVPVTETVPAAVPQGEEPWDPNTPLQWDVLPPPASSLPPVAPRPPQPARGSRLRIVPRTLTNRLVLGVVTLVTVLVLGIGTGSYFALQSFLMNRLDQQVQTTAGGSLRLLFNGQGSQFMPVQFPQQVWAVALDPSGAVITQPSSNAVNPMNLSAGDRRMLVSRSDGSSPVTVTTTDGVQLRAVVRSNEVRVISPTLNEPATAVIGLSTSDVQNTLHQLLLIELAIGAGAVVLALLATTYGVRLSLRPLRRVTRTAQEVTAELSSEGTGLDRRVPIAASEAESEAGQMAASINTLLGAVETQFAARVESEERMRQFLADASHELRTPLTSIRGYAELSRMRRIGDEPIDDADTLARIESEGTRMSRLVEDLLLLARSDRGAPLQYEAVDVGELVDDAVEGARIAHPERQIEAAVVPVTVLGDRDQLRRVLVNLLTNAAVHTAPEGAIQVRAWREGAEALLQVRDAGPGLPAEEAAHVFERFWRADRARTRARGGSGLGLSIVSAIVAAHGGTVSFESSVEAGSAVTVRLPVDSA
jgi:two-component system, OmpR family, sensor kinase